MKLVNLASGPGALVGDDEVADLSSVAEDVLGIVTGGPDALAAAERALRSADRIPRAGLKLDAPVRRPPKFLAIGMNYAAHIEETGRERPEHQVWFNKQSTCVIGPGDAIVLPAVSATVDYEGELGVVISQRCRHVPRERARDVVAGWTVINDVSARDWQWRTAQWTLGKSFDTHGPMGPALVTIDELPDPSGLRLRTWVNDDLRQDASTDEMIFDVWDMIAELSTVFTLEPGDVLSTGTPSGCGFALEPPDFLDEGDTVRIEIERVGVLENPVVAEAP
jgi:2-keto-4-pentenoate hydratase/2-oxohepta-3-ene-1,7-dioic acid hydratase in catechol pathway